MKDNRPVRKLYVAYGSNLNIEQMKYRCPTAKLVGTGMAKNFELQFKGREGHAFATISPKEGAETPIAVWEIGKYDEVCLDRYEGYPNSYYKQDVPVEVDGKTFSAMAYIMNQRYEFGIPNPYYYATVNKGYKDCGLDTTYLEEAIAESSKQYYKLNAPRFYSELKEGEEEEYDEDDVIDEDDDIDEGDGDGWDYRM